MRIFDIMVVISPIANGHQYPDSARSLLICGSAVINIGKYILIREIAKYNKWIKNISILCWQRARQLIFLIRDRCYMTSSGWEVGWR